MARIPSRDFNPAAPVYVRRFFVAAGRHWNPGDLFTWRHLSVAQRRVKQLYDAGKLMHGAAEPSKSDWAGLQARESAATAPQITPEPTIETEVEDQDILAAAASAEDDLSDLDMKQLRAIVDEMRENGQDVPYRVSRDAQRDAIREARRGEDK